MRRERIGKRSVNLSAAATLLWGRVDEIIRTINEGLAGNPSPIFIEATRILAQEGPEAAIAYLESHKSQQLARAERAAAQMEAAQETLQRELQPLVLQAELHQIRLRMGRGARFVGHRG